MENVMNWVHLPNDNRVFVFGSNEAGRHGAGAALYAHHALGATPGGGHGMMKNRRSYAIPTKDQFLNTLPLEAIEKYVNNFVYYASNIEPTLQFFVSEVGCGLAGYTPEQIAPMFEFVPGNVDLPPGWR